MRTPMQRLNLVRGFRVRRMRAAPIDDGVRVIHDRLEASIGRADSIEDAWRRVLPSDLTPSVRSLRVIRGELRVQCRDAPSRFMIDRWVRGGGLEQVRRICPVLRRIAGR